MSSARNESRLFQDERYAALLAHYLEGRIAGQDLWRLDAQKLNFLISPLQKILRIAQEYPSVLALAAKTPDMPIEAQIPRNRLRALDQQMLTAHNAFIDALRETFPDIAARPHIGPTQQDLLKDPFTAPMLMQRLFTPQEKQL